MLFCVFFCCFLVESCQTNIDLRVISIEVNLECIYVLRDLFYEEFQSNSFCCQRKSTLIKSEVYIYSLYVIFPFFPSIWTALQHKFGIKTEKYLQKHLKVHVRFLQAFCKSFTFLSQSTRNVGKKKLCKSKFFVIF